MMKKLLFILLTLLGMSTSPTTQAQHVVSHELIASYTFEDMENLINDFISGLPVPAATIVGILNLQHGVNVYKVTYNTTHPVVGDITATGALALPIDAPDPCPDNPIGFPMAVYQHGTTFNTEGVPSFLSVEHNIGVMMASAGYIGVMPDYMGLGDNEANIMHPYVHAKTEALAGIDLMRATRELTQTLDFTWNQQVFVFGYSQGGHGAMALFKELETNYANEFTVTACAPMSGPYDISETQANVMWDHYSSPSYIPYVVAGYQAVYPDLLGDFNEIFNPDYAAFNGFSGGSTDFFAILNSTPLPDTPSHIFLNNILDDYVSDEDHPLKLALRDNDLYDWTPKAPVFIMGCCDDEQVVYESAIIAEEKFIENGATDVQRVDFCETVPILGPFGHGGCVPFCLLEGKQFFDSFVNCEAVGIDQASNSHKVNLYPNPAQNKVYFELPNLGTVPFKIQVTNITGQIVQTVTDIVGTQFELNISDLQAGMYIVEVRGFTVDYKEKLMVY